MISLTEARLEAGILPGSVLSTLQMAQLETRTLKEKEEANG